MDISKIFGGNIKIIAVALPALIILFPLGYSIAATVFSPEAGMPQPFLERPDPQHKECVRETTYMRYHHWELLRHVREEVVRYGQRGEIGLKKCGTCHTSREKFCDQCHNAVSMTPDCFDCHYYP
jgi:hypothetical protein